MDVTVAAAPRVLIADDETDVLFALRLLLEAEGCRADTAASPSAIVQAVARESYDLLLMDLNYAYGHTSGREGLDIVSRVRQVDRLLPVVAMTGYATLDLVVDALRVGVTDLIQKPWQNASLVDRLRQVIATGQRRRRVVRKRDREARDVGVVQRALLPRGLPAVDGWDVSVEWTPADDVGGDYYDVIRLDADRVAVCMADVAGKGLPAAMLMSNLQAVIRSAATAEAGPAEVCTRANRALLASTDGARFVTLFYGVLDTRARTFCCSNAGHPPPLLGRADGTQQWLSEGGVVLGIMPDWTYRQESVSVHSGDRLVLYTDGISEAGAAAGREFGSRGVAAVLATGRFPDAVSLRDAVLYAASRFCDGVFEDDATLMVLAAR